jgi:hypothetical protein
MIMKLCSRFFLFAFVLSIATGAAAPAQQAQNKDVVSFNYGFVSPNTRDDLKLKDAIRGMNSAEETKLLRRAMNLGCVVRLKIATMRALGSWSDGAEHSILLRANSDESTIRYLMSRLGREANQKAVIYFHPEAFGSARIYLIRLRQRSHNSFSIARTLDRIGISFRTMVPGKRETIVYIVDTENNLAAKVMTAAKRLRGRLTSQPGTASFIGDDSDRQKGQAVFAKEVSDYESKHPDLPPPCTATN